MTDLRADELGERLDRSIQAMQGVARENGVSMRDYVDTRLAAMDRALDAAKTALEYRLNSMNELREQVNERDKMFVTKAEYTTNVKLLESQVKSLELSRAEMQGKASQSAMIIAYIVSVIGVLLGAAGLIMN